MQFFDGEFFALGFHFHGQSEFGPAGREIVDVNLIVMPGGFRPRPASQRTRNVKQRLAVPGIDGRCGGIFNAQFVGQAAVMMDVVNDR